MFTETEIEVILENPKVFEATKKLHRDFLKTEHLYLDISEHDFFSLIMLAPQVGVALANDDISLKEELALNKKARKASKGRFFLKKDPVVDAMKFVIKKYRNWEDRFFEVLILAMHESFDIKSMESELPTDFEVTQSVYSKEVLKAPFIFIRFISSFFLEQDEEIMGERRLSKTDHEGLVQIGEKLGLSKIPLFKMFCATFTIR